MSLRKQEMLNRNSSFW